MSKLIEVNGCMGCPFMYSEYDEYSMGFNTTDRCSLSMFLQQPDYFINCRDASDVELDFNTPDWCPIQDDILIKKIK